MDFLFLESQIIDRLGERLSPDIHRLTAADLSGVAEGSQPTPAVHVVFDGYRVRDSNNAFAAITQQWLTVIAVRNRRGGSTGGGARADAGPIIGEVLSSLLGWRPDGAKALKIASAPRPGYVAGFAYFPLSWTTELTVRTECQ